MAAKFTQETAQAKIDSLANYKLSIIKFAGKCNLRSTFLDEDRGVTLSIAESTCPFHGLIELRFFTE